MICVMANGVNQHVCNQQVIALCEHNALWLIWSMAGGGKTHVRTLKFDRCKTNEWMIYIYRLRCEPKHLHYIILEQGATLRPGKCCTHGRRQKTECRTIFRYDNCVRPVLLVICVIYGKWIFLSEIEISMLHVKVRSAINNKRRSISAFYLLPLILGTWLIWMGTICCIPVPMLSCNTFGKWICVFEIELYKPSVTVCSAITPKRRNVSERCLLPYVVGSWNIWSGATWCTLVPWLRCDTFWK